MTRPTRTNLSIRLASRAAVLAIGLTTLLTPSVFAQGNPLDRANREPAREFLGPAALDLPWFYEGEGLTVALDVLEDRTDNMIGRIRMGQDVFPLRGRYESKTLLRGAFTAGGKAYDFTLEADEQGLAGAFKTGDSTYRMSGSYQASVPMPEARVEDPNGLNRGQSGGADVQVLNQASAAMGARDYAKAIQLIGDLAERGHVGASYVIGSTYAYGLGREKDPQQALRYFEQAARGEHAGAFYELGTMYAMGAGVSKDEARALGYFERGAKVGDLASIGYYGHMVLNGVGRQADFVEGIAWVSVAADRGDEGAKQTLDYYKQDQSVSEQDRQRVTERASAILQTLRGDPSQMDDLVDYNRFVEVAGGPQRQQQNERREVTVDPFSGSWSGTATEQMDDGSMGRSPIRLTVARTGDGYSADIVLEMTMPMANGQMANIRATGQFRGAAQSGQLLMRASDTTMTITQTGESASLGPQQLTAQVNGATMTGRIGSDYDGWTTFNATRQGGTNQIQRADPVREGGQWGGSGGASRLERPRGNGGGSVPSGGSAPSVTLEPVTLRDQGMGNVTSHTLLAPKGWQVQGGPVWSRPELYQDFMHLNLRVTGPDGSALSVYPGGIYQWSDIYEINANAGLMDRTQIPRPGQTLPEGLTFMPMPQTTAGYALQHVIGKHRPNATNVQVVEAKELTDILAIAREQARGQYESIEQDNARTRQMGMGGGTQLTQFADKVRVTYQENGQAFEEELYVVGWAMMSQIAMAGNQGPMMSKAVWSVTDVSGARTPVGVANQRPVVEAIGLSLRPDPRWQAMIIQLRNQIAKGVMDGIVKRGEINKAAMDAAWESHQQAVRSQSESTDRINTKFVNAMREVDDYASTDGTTVQLPSHYNNVYTDGQGGYILSDTIIEDAYLTRINPVNP